MNGYLKIQCADNCGNTGTFIAESLYKNSRAISPVFPTMAELSVWLRANNWKQKGYYSEAYYVKGE